MKPWYRIGRKQIGIGALKIYPDQGVRVTISVSNDGSLPQVVYASINLSCPEGPYLRGTHTTAQEIPAGATGAQLIKDFTNAEWGDWGIGNYDIEIELKDDSTGDIIDTYSAVDSLTVQGTANPMISNVALSTI